MTPPHTVAFLLDNLAGGGAERVVLEVAAGFVSLGYDVDLLVREMRGELTDHIPSGVNLITLDAGGAVSSLRAALRAAGNAPGNSIAGVWSFVFRAKKIPRFFRNIAALQRYLVARQPAVLFSALPKANVCSVLACAADNVKTRAFVGIQNEVSVRVAQGRERGKGQMRHMVTLIRETYQRADGVVASSQGVARDAIDFLGLDPQGVEVVYNPVELNACTTSTEVAPHPWLEKGQAPVILGIGRLVEQKNFSLLIRAFAKVTEQKDARLIILGGDESSEDQQDMHQTLLALAEELGVSQSVDLVGYQHKPQDYLSRSAVFALSSRHEGFGNVLVEALLSGCPVVSTDCPSGPAEILADGEFGRLVPVGDSDGLAEAIVATLNNPPSGQVLRERGAQFSAPRAIEHYRSVFFDSGTN